jgi:hypothetical protein
MQAGGKRNPLKNPQIAAAWMVLSLLQEQGGCPVVAGKRDAGRSGSALRLE